MGKMVVLKPVVWNSQGYVRPTGENMSGGYAGDHGYGHEEWNGRSDWVWKNWKIFHTQGKGRMFSYAETGDLGIVMTTMKDGRFYAVGAACAVYANDAGEQAEIARDLKLHANGAELWKLAAIRRLKKDRADFDRHWDQAHECVQWRCPQSHFIWFDPPVPYDPEAVIPSAEPGRPRQATIKMHSGYQAIRPDQAVAIMAGRLPLSHPIRGWLATADFDDVRNRSVRDAPPPRSNGASRSAGTATDAYTRYLQENEVYITPKHHLLQSAFEAFLKSANARQIEANVDRVDVRYHDAEHGPVLAEVKPSDAQTARFAIRTAIGQLLDYRQKAKGAPRLLIVIGCEPPSLDDIKLALDNGVGLAWQKSQGFEVRWPQSGCPRGDGSPLDGEQRNPRPRPANISARAG